VNASEQIDRLIERTADWRGETLASLRKTILGADKDIVEEWKWMGSPVWSRDGIIAVGNPHKGKVKLTFEHGARLPDPEKLFNAGLEGNQRRAINYLEGDRVNAPALKNLVRAAIAYNQARQSGKRSNKGSNRGSKKALAPKAKKVATAKKVGKR
jgi:hypothetical protein